MQRLLSILSGLLFFSFVSSGIAQVGFKVNVENKIVALNGYVRIQYRLDYENNATSFTPPPFADFTIVQGPEQITGMQNINGQVSNYSTFSYVLKPSKKGRFIFPPAKATMDGKLFQSASVAVEVNEHGAPMRINGSGENDSPELLEEFILHKNESAVEKIKRNVFVRLEVNKKSVYIGEPIVATYKLYTRVNSESRITRRPSLNGFSVFDMMEPDAQTVLNEKYKGKDYNVYILRKAQLYPLREGEFELESMDVENAVSFIREDYAIDENSLMKMLRQYGEDGLHPDAWIREVVNTSSQPVNITVKPLPAGITAGGFNGAVGSFVISADLPDKKIRQDDVVDLKVTVSGSGNLPLLGNPDIHWPDSMETYETKIQEQLNKQTSPISGKKIFTIPFSTRQLGRIELPPIILTTFNPQLGKYETSQTAAMIINVEPAEKKTRKFFDKIVPAVKSPGYESWMVGLFIFLSAAFVAGIFYFVNKRKVKKPLQPFPAEQSTPVAIKPLDEAPAAIPTIEMPAQLLEWIELSKPAEFYRDLENLMRKLLQQKFGIGKFETIPSIQQSLRAKGIGNEEIRMMTELLEDCALSKYTPFVLEDKMNADYIKGTELLIKLQSSATANP
jgi:BatD DUF11 like domain